MSEIDPITGLPKELGAWEEITKENQTIKIYNIKKKFGKVYTVIEGITDVNMKELTKKLKNSLACGGTCKEGKIELQGEHKQKVMATLVEAGFAPETIEVK